MEAVIRDILSNATLTSIEDIGLLQGLKTILAMRL